MVGELWQTSLSQMSPRHVDKLIKVFSHISSSCQTEAWLLQPLQIDWWRQEMCNTLQICKEFYIKGLQPRSWNNTKSLSFPSSLLLSLSCSLALLRSCAAEGGVVLLIWSLLLLLSAKKVTHKNTLTHITHTHMHAHACREKERDSLFTSRMWSCRLYLTACHKTYNVVVAL